MNLLLKHITIISLLFFTCCFSTRAQDSRAVGLYVNSFMKYFLWPDEPKSELVVGIYGKSNAIAYLQKTLEGKKTKKVRNMPVKLKILSSLSEITTCSIILVSKEKSSELNQINNLISGLPIVIITMVPEYNTGPVINIDADNSFNLEICSKNIRATGIKISTTLTQLAKEI